MITSLTHSIMNNFTAVERFQPHGRLYFFKAIQEPQQPQVRPFIFCSYHALAFIERHLIHVLLQQKGVGGTSITQVNLLGKET